MKISKAINIFQFVRLHAGFRHASISNELPLKNEHGSLLLFLIVLEHRRVRTRTPVPHDLLQLDQSLHSSQRMLVFTNTKQTQISEMKLHFKKLINLLSKSFTGLFNGNIGPVVGFSGAVVWIRCLLSGGSHGVSLKKYRD